MVDRTSAPYGSWRSPFRIDDLVGDVVSLAEPWVDGDAARRAGQDVAGFAESEAARWRDGLASWQQDFERG